MVRETYLGNCQQLTRVCQSDFEAAVVLEISSQSLPSSLGLGVREVKIAVMYHEMLAQSLSVKAIASPKCDSAVFVAVDFLILVCSSHLLVLSLSMVIYPAHLDCGLAKFDVRVLATACQAREKSLEISWPRVDCEFGLLAAIATVFLEVTAVGNNGEVVIFCWRRGLLFCLAEFVTGDGKLETDCVVERL